MTRPTVRGVNLDSETRCKHWHSPRDIVAIRMKCCGEYYACKDCHDEIARHAPQVWPKGEWDIKAVLCGSCGAEHSVGEYLGCDNRCPACGAAFNPGCANHHHFYFEI